MRRNVVRALRKPSLLLWLISLLLVACRPGAGVEIEPDKVPTETAVVVEQDAESVQPLGETAAELVEEGRSLLESDDCEAALGPLQQAVELDPESTDALLVLGNAFARSGLHDLAIDAYKTAIDLDQSFAAAYSNLGAAHLRRAEDMQSIEAAVGAFQNAIELEPENAENHANMGSALLQSSQIPQAEDEYLEALRLDPALAEAHVGLGYVYLIQGQAEEALPHFVQASDLDPEMPEALFALGIAYIETGRIDEATVTLESFLAIEIPAGCAGDREAAERARVQAEAILAELRGQ
jgi:tetratricopeptide (TPR) repeat protein